MLVLFIYHDNFTFHNLNPKYHFIFYIFDNYGGLLQFNRITLYSLFIIVSDIIQFMCM